MKNQVTNGFDRMTVSNFLMKANFIIGEMTANAVYFPSPNPSLTNLQTAVDALTAANLVAEHGDRVSIAIRIEKKNELIGMLRKLGIYVNLMADTNRAIAFMSGFDVAKEASPAPPITFVEAPVLSSGLNPGELAARVTRVPGGRAYQFLISKNSALPLAQWAINSATKASFYFKALETATRYYVRVAAVGVNQQLVYSDVSSFVTQ
jgi:hypothetical protein